ncbi:DUF3199 family protein [Clostridium sp. D33t1_170424_F3]|uniref:protein YqbG n=1 Tax=Clostridium sp. D33t1_170424_F3 TaxID=2787099 RepID=UPI0018A93A9C|nr:DUF3199 family protein [Clostridium sp. D33t1_170424_F3]
MAERPWATPADIKAYSDFQAVKNRTDEKLKIDVTRAEQYIISYTNNRFDDNTKYPQIPEAVKTAVILVAEVYAYNAVEGERRLKSETFDDYSYTLSDTNAPKLDALDLGPLLDDFVLVQARSGVTMKLRKL